MMFFLPDRNKKSDNHCPKTLQTDLRKHLIYFFSWFPRRIFLGRQECAPSYATGQGGEVVNNNSWRWRNRALTSLQFRPFRHFRSKVQSRELSFSIYISSGEDGHFLPQRPALYTANNSTQVSRLGFSSSLVLAAHRYVRGHRWHVSGHDGLDAAFLFFRSRNCCWLLAREVYFKTWVCPFSMYRNVTANVSTHEEWAA